MTLSYTNIFRYDKKGVIQKRKPFKLNFTKIKNFNFSKDMVREMQRKFRDLGKIFAEHISYRVMSRIYKKYLKTKNKKIENRHISTKKMHGWQINTRKGPEHHLSLRKCRLKAK